MTRRLAVFDCDGTLIDSRSPIRGGGENGEDALAAGAGIGGTALFAGIAELLDGLLADGWLLAVATGMSDRGLGLCLARHGLARHFVTAQTVDRHPSKPHPAMLQAAIAAAGASRERTTMIGDTMQDMAMARAAGVRGLGVTWGCHPPAALRAAGACAVAGDCGELLRLLDDAG